MVGQQKKKRSLEPLKRLFHHSENTCFWQKINIGRKNTSSLWLISLRKIQPCKLFPQVEENFNNLISSEGQK